PAVELARDVEAREQEADGLHLLGEADLQRADPAAAIGWLDRALSLAHASGNRYQAAAVQATLGVAHLRAGHLDRAREHLDTAGRLNAAVPDDATVQRLREAGAEYRDRTGQAGGCGVAAIRRSSAGRLMTTQRGPVTT